MENNFAHGRLPEIMESTGYMQPTDFKAIRRLAGDISMIENEMPGYEALLMRDDNAAAKVIGITGAPGSGKSTLTDALINSIVHDGKKVAVLCVDPSSPFNRGALLGDRIRMSEWYNHPAVFIRSLASRGSLGGLHPRILEITEYIKKQHFDFVIIETVGVGQSEVDIAALADLTIVVLTPEGGDDVQNMKSGLMEIADVFVVNKSDRPGADEFYHNLKKMIGPVYKTHRDLVPVFQVTATAKAGVERLYQYIGAFQTSALTDAKKQLLAQKGYMILQSFMMRHVDQDAFQRQLYSELHAGPVNLFAFARSYAERYLPDGD